MAALSRNLTIPELAKVIPKCQVVLTRCDRYKCSGCSKRFSRKTDLRQHHKESRRKFKERERFCVTCERAFYSKESLRAHKLTFHNGEGVQGRVFTCQHCSKKFAFKRAWQIHVRTHTGERPYSCEICGKRFNTTVTKKLHLRTHTQEKPYQCGVCHKNYAVRESLRRHRQQVHKINQNLPTHQCLFCDKSFVYEHQWENHTRAHIGEKPFECRYCDKSYCVDDHRKQHEKSHFRPVPEDGTVVCKLCNRRFASDDKLQQHHARVHVDKFECNVCKKEYGSKQLVYRHVWTVHKKAWCTQIA